MAAGGPRGGSSHCLVCNVGVTEGSDSRDIFQHSSLAQRLQPILQVGLYEGTTFTHNLCLNCEIQVGMIEEYYKVLEKFRKNFAHTASYYGLELVPIPEAQKPTYQFIQAATQQTQQTQLPAFSQAPTPTQPPTPAQIQVQTPVNQGHWEEILFCLEPQGAQPAPQTVLSPAQNAMVTPVATLVQHHHQQQQPQQTQQQPQLQQQQQHTQQQQQQQQQLETQHHHSQLHQQQNQQLLPHQQQQHQHQNQHQEHHQLQTIDKSALTRVPGFYVYKKNAPRHPLTDRQHVCSVCNKGFLNGTHLKQHMRSHTGERPYKCPECPAAFSMQCNLKRHLLLHTGERPYNCSHCGSRYKQLAHLKRHMRTHDGSKPFECEHCSKNFRFEHDFKEHMRLHTGEGPYRCEICGNTFLRQRSYKEHLKVHSDERPHKCSICPAAYKRRSELVIHVRRHTGEKPFPCDVCGKAFVTSSKLSIHKALHKDLRPYECSTCLAKFKQKNNLKAHERRHEERKTMVLAEMEVGEETLRKTIIEEIKIKKKKKKKKRKQLMVDSSTSTSDNIKCDELDTQENDLELRHAAVATIEENDQDSLLAVELHEVSTSQEHHYEVIVMNEEHQETVHQLTSDAENNGVATILVREVGQEGNDLLSAENIVPQGSQLVESEPNGAAVVSENTPPS